MRILISAGVLSVCLAAHPALATAGDPATTTIARASEGSQEQTVGTVTGEKVICRSDKEIGSRVKSKRVCMTAKQWAEKTAEERQFIEQRQAQRTVAGN